MGMGLSRDQRRVPDQPKSFRMSHIDRNVHRAACQRSTVGRVIDADFDSTNLLIALSSYYYLLFYYY